jgi:hypothetical protein
MSGAIITPYELDPLPDDYPAFQQSKLCWRQLICRVRQACELILRPFGRQLLARHQLDLVDWQMTFEARPPAHTWFFLAPTAMTKLALREYRWRTMLYLTGCASCRTKGATRFA